MPALTAAADDDAHVDSWHTLTYERDLSFVELSPKVTMAVLASDNGDVTELRDM